MEDKFADEEDRKEGLKRMESRFDEFHTAAEDAGVDWSDVTVSKVDTSKKSTGGPFGVSKSAESTFKSVRAIVTITSKGKDYEVTLNCEYASSVGWFLDGPPHWPRTRTRPRR
jgi:thioredoxin reductase